MNLYKIKTVLLTVIVFKRTAQKLPLLTVRPKFFGGCYRIKKKIKVV